MHMDLAPEEIGECKGNTNGENRKHHTFKTNTDPGNNRRRCTCHRSFSNLAYRTPGSGSIILCDKDKGDTEEYTHTACKSIPEPGSNAIDTRLIALIKKQI